MSGQQTDKPKKKKFPINRPNTSFSMKANLVQREPQFQQRWAALDLYRKLREADHPAGPFVFHDGPPYANGDIHIGHLLNKVLKDLVVRTRLMAGHDVDFVPGWDCHGLPIEHRVMKELGDAAKDMDAVKIRRKCQAYAEKFVKTQAKQMQRLGTLADYEDPYITMDPAYEAGVIEVFADLVEQKLVYRALKPVHWSIANQTALAEAELEYYDREDTSVYVRFPLFGAGGAYGVDHPCKGKVDDAFRALSGSDLLIWTTTPWTLPANMAVAISATAEYGIYETDRRSVVMAVDLAESVLAKAGITERTPLAIFRGHDLMHLEYAHPFMDEQVERQVVTADYVTLEDGTGLVHTAPGHGVEDYQTGLREGLDIYCPVQADGTFDDTVPEWLRGKSVWEANELVVEHLRQSGHLFHAHQFTHSYPHDWRSKTPVIFRATEQWFVYMDHPFGSAGATKSPASLRDRALAATATDVKFIPEWGRNRMRGMLENAPDWCISRQRSWGLPIPVFTHKYSGKALLTAESVRHVASIFRDKGSDVWFVAPARDLLRGCPGVDNPDDWEKGSDIFDVWFESGSSWRPVLQAPDREIGYPADLYLEGSDQHRGWFQKALLTSLGATGQPSFRALLTHGFMVDARGEKMSKSGGNAINVEDLMKEHGADICRWWVAGLSYANDIKVDWEFFRLAGEEYRKVRNTIRFLLGNLGDFDNGQDRRELGEGDARSVDAWAAGRLNDLVATVRRAYDAYEFRRAGEAIFNFCNDTMSAVYLAAVKDRLYCDAADSDRRRRTQTVLHDIADALIRLIAPILVHTADEAWLALRGADMDADDCVHLRALPSADDRRIDPAWDEVMALRDRALKVLEDARSQRGLDNPLDAGVEVAVPAEAYARLKPFEPEMADLCGVSRFRFKFDENGEETIGVEDLTAEPRCDRSWKRDGTVGRYTDAEGEAVHLTGRDAEALGLA